MTDVPYMRMFWGDYLGDTQHLTCEQHGAYLLLIAAYWRAQKPLPDDDAHLSRLCRLSSKKWKSISPAVKLFFNKKDGHLEHKRIEKELLRVSERSRSASRAASVRHSVRNAQDMPYQSPELRKNNRQAKALYDPRPRPPAVEEKSTPTEPDEFSIPRDMQPKCRLADKFVALYQKHWPNESRMPPLTMNLEAEAATWLGQLAEGKIAAVLEDQMRRIAEKGNPPPRSLAMFRNDLQTAAAKAKGTSDEGGDARHQAFLKSQAFSELQRRRSRWIHLKPLALEVMTPQERADWDVLNKEFGPG